MSFRIELPLPPSANSLYLNSNAPGRRRRRSPEYHAWLWEAAIAVGFRSGRAIQVVGPYSLRVLLPEKMRGDCDNRLKAVSDFLVSLKFTPDDRHCMRVSAERDSSVPPGRCVVLAEAA